MNQIFLPEYPYSYKLLLLNFFAIEQQQLQSEQKEKNKIMEFNDEVS